MRGVILTILFLGGGINGAQHNYELYIKGGGITLMPGALIHVQGDVHLDAGPDGERGCLNNDGTIELRGNFHIEHSNTEQTDGTSTLPGTSEGVVRFKNSGFSMETSHRNESQAIVISISAGDATGPRAFYNLEVENDNETVVDASDNLVFFYGGDVEVKNRLEFVNDSRLRTDRSESLGTPPTGEDYDYRLLISNPQPGAIVGASTVPGDGSRYVEGKLTRTVAGTGTYYFPVGLQPMFAGADGMAAFELRTVSSVSQQVNAYLTDQVTPLEFPQIYCDIGDYPDPMGGDQPWTTCVGGPDGLYDFVPLNISASHEWVIQNSGPDFSYDLEVYPGSGLDATVSTSGGFCGAPWHLRFLAKDGALMQAGTIASVINPPPPFNTSPQFPPGFRICPPATYQEGNSLSGQSGFSRFRLHGGYVSESLLPVELIALRAEGVDGRYIRVDWATVSEVNNEGFFIERSLDGHNFSTVGWRPGAGTTSEPQDYQFDDLDVEAGSIYYYRLKQMDYDGGYWYTPVVSAMLQPANRESTVVLYPNPVRGTSSFLGLYSPVSGLVEVCLLNAMGQEVKRINYPLHAGYNRFDLPVSSLIPGTYMVRVYGPAGLHTEKLMVL